jgi:serine phosphatase RsbU (regulator of sigma subunit)
VEASTILENARLLDQERLKLKMEEELNIAREIQRNLLPRKLPFSGWFRAAGSSLPSMQVGGDYYDMRQLSPACWASVVADVSGKGVSSALVASLLQGAFLAGAERAEQGAAEMAAMMRRVNAFLIERTEGEKYATVFFCTLESNGLLRWTNAGHCPPIVLRATGEIQMLQATGMPVGLIEEAEFEVLETQLAPGDKLVAYSDGVAEARNPEGKYFDVRRVVQVLKENQESSSQTLNSALIDAVESYTRGVAQADDITTVVIEYQPE